ncbi:AMP-binding protein [Streptomyces olivaceus]|uniref:AMP-binding protein n=1 Tax=Streptomyces olivaceus TaxID=47716 RepID=UPI0022ED7BBA|nr:AMP-binding protein [Streptomyces olivaceus]GHI94686.1 peptide synthase [Streptomyces olivaceus]
MADLHARLEQLAADRPHDTALVLGRRDRSGRAITFARLVAGCREAADAFERAGVRRGHKAVTMTGDPYHLFTTVHGLLAVGAVPVLVDPGLPRADLRQCLDEVAPEVFVGQPLAHLGRTALGWARGHVRTAVVTGATVPGLRRRLPVPGARRGGAPAGPPPVRGPFPHAPDDGLALIAFTSGSTGVPKGAEYHHSTLLGQAETLARLVGTDGTLFAGFLPVVLLGPVLGHTTVAPAVNHRAPARTPSARLVRPLLENRTQVVVGSPAVLGLLAEHCARRRLVLSCVDRVVSFGAPLRAGLADALHAVLRPDAEVLSAYGATECLPVSAVSTTDARAPGAGTCVGRPLDGVAARILDAGPDGVGEIAVTGANVSPAYHARPEITAATKTATDRGVQHRTGDMGLIDGEGRIWFHGRRSHRVIGTDYVLTTEDVEAAADTLPGVRRTALVGVGAPGRQRAVLCVELTARGPGRGAAVAAVRELLDRRPEGRHVAAVLVHPGFPTDIRHNSKINRDRLADWATRRLRRPR